MNFIYSKDFYKDFFQTSFKAFIEQQKEDHARQLEAEKQARERAKKETLLQETRFGAKPSTPAKLKGWNLF